MSVNWQTGQEPVAGYRLIERLGKGGFGEVWKAEGPGGFQVALKAVSLEGDAGKVETRALEIVRQIRHPQLIATFGTWQVDDTLIIAMELADRTLLDRFRESAGQGFPGIPEPEIFEYFLDAARGLDYLNEPRHTGGGSGLHGIQHRDIKPQNLLIVGGSVKVADYGLARILERTQTSHTGSMTPLYAAPEFFEGKTSSQSDQYSLAATYCHMRGGRPPFSGSAAQIMYGHATQPPDLSMLPEAERRAVERALSKHPTDRWPTCRAFIEAVRSANRSPDPVDSWPETRIVAKKTAGSRRTRNLRTLAGTGAVMLLAISVAAYFQFMPAQDGNAHKAELKEQSLPPSILRDSNQHEPSARPKTVATLDSSSIKVESKKHESAKVGSKQSSPPSKTTGTPPASATSSKNEGDSVKDFELKREAAWRAVAEMIAAAEAAGRVNTSIEPPPILDILVLGRASDAEALKAVTEAQPKAGLSPEVFGAWFTGQGRMEGAKPDLNVRLFNPNSRESRTFFSNRAVLLKRSLEVPRSGAGAATLRDLRSSNESGSKGDRFEVKREAAWRAVAEMIAAAEAAGRVKTSIEPPPILDILILGRAEDAEVLKRITQKEPQVGVSPEVFAAWFAGQGRMEGIKPELNIRIFSPSGGLGDMFKNRLEGLMPHLREARKAVSPNP